MSERKKYNLEGLTEVYTNIYHWKKNNYIIVKDGEHYMINKDRLDRLVKSSHGRPNEIAQWFFKPRVRKPRDPNAPKKEKTKILGGAIETERLVGGYIDPDYIFKCQKKLYTKEGIEILKK